MVRTRKQSRSGTIGSSTLRPKIDWPLPFPVATAQEIAWRGQVARTPEQKRELAARLEKENHEMLASIKEFSRAFGQLKVVAYEPEPKT